MRVMPRIQPLLHEAMRTILLDFPDRVATLEALSKENIKRDLYRQKKGEGRHPQPFQFRLRALQYPGWFDFLPPDTVKYIGPQ